MARRLVENWVRFVTVVYGGWDHHTSIKAHGPKRCGSARRDDPSNELR
jgi:hypothetical protein